MFECCYLLPHMITAIKPYKQYSHTRHHELQAFKIILTLCYTTVFHRNSKWHHLEWLMWILEPPHPTPPSYYLKVWSLRLSPTPLDKGEVIDFWDMRMRRQVSKNYCHKQGDSHQSLFRVYSAYVLDKFQALEII